MHHLAHALQHRAITVHHVARAGQHPTSVLPLRVDSLHGKESLADCTLVMREARHPAASIAIRTVPTTVIGTLLTLSMSNHTAHQAAMCKSCYRVYLILNEPVCSNLSRTLELSGTVTLFYCHLLCFFANRKLSRCHVVCHFAKLKNCFDSNYNVLPVPLAS